MKFFIILICFSKLFGDLIYPPNNHKINHIHVMFEWGKVNETTSYEIELSNSSSFSNLLFNNSTSDTSIIIQENINWQSTYYWRVKPSNGDYIDTFTFSTSNTSYQFSNDVNPVSIITNNLESEDEIVIYGIMSPFYSAAIDMNGNEIWNSGGVDTYMFSQVKDNVFLGNANLPPHFKGELGVEFDMKNGITWEQPTYGDTDEFLQHEIIKLPNGNYMGFVIVYLDHFVPNSNDYPQIPEEYDFPFEDNIPGFSDSFDYPWTWKSERIVEWDTDGNEVWSWNPFDHYDLNNFDYISGFWEKAASSGEPFDWTHFNALAYDEIENCVYVSSKNLSRITKIDKATGDVIWNVGVNWTGEDIINFDWPPSENSINSEMSTMPFSGQHGLEILDNGNLVFFDNGILSGRFDGTNTYKSRAMEIKVNDQNNEHIVEIIWSYTLPTELYGVISGNVQKLDNGNYFITTVGSTDGAHGIEVTPSKEIVWDCKFNVGTPQGAIYRAMKINGLYDANMDLECFELIGDINDDSAWDVVDIVALANCILATNCDDLENGCAGDMNENGRLNVIDVIVLINCILNENCASL